MSIRIAILTGLIVTALSNAASLAAEPPNGASSDSERANEESKKDDTERARAEERLGIAIAKARAFSPAVAAMESQFARVLRDLRAHQLLLDRESNSLRRSYGFGPGAQARRSGDAAGRAYLFRQISLLEQQKEQLEKTFAKTLQDEAWKQLAPYEQRQVVKHELLPGYTIKDLQHAADEDATAQPSKKPLPSQPLSNWHRMRLNQLRHEASFPVQPKDVSTQDSESFEVTQGATTYRVTHYIKPEVPEGATAADVAEAQAAANVENQMKEGRPAARHTVRLAGEASQEMCVFYRAGSTKRVDRSRITVLHGSLFIAEVLGIDLDDPRAEDRAGKFFSSLTAIAE